MIEVTIRIDEDGKQKVFSKLYKVAPGQIVPVEAAKAAADAAARCALLWKWDVEE